VGDLRGEWSNLATGGGRRRGERILSKTVVNETERVETPRGAA
jgi:hypothetical protein